MSGTNLKFCQIAANDKGLFALAEDGAVYRYVPSGEGATRNAFWSRLTTFAATSGRERKVEAQEKQLELLADRLVPILAERLKESAT